MNLASHCSHFYQPLSLCSAGGAHGKWFWLFVQLYMPLQMRRRPELLLTSLVLALVRPIFVSQVGSHVRMKVRGPEVRLATVGTDVRALPVSL